MISKEHVSGLSEWTEYDTIQALSTLKHGVYEAHEQSDTPPEKHYLDYDKLSQAFQNITKDTSILQCTISSSGETPPTVYITFQGQKESIPYLTYRLDWRDAIYFELAGVYNTTKYSNLSKDHHAYPLLLAKNHLSIAKEYEQLEAISQSIKKTTDQERQTIMELWNRYIQGFKVKKTRKKINENKKWFRQWKRQIGIALPQQLPSLKPPFDKLYRPASGEEDPTLRDARIDLCSDNECWFEYGYNCHTFVVFYTLYAHGYPSLLTTHNYLDPHLGAIDIFLTHSCLPIRKQKIEKTDGKYIIPSCNTQPGDIVVLYRQEGGHLIPLHSGIAVQKWDQAESFLLSKLGVGQGVFYGNTEKVFEAYANIPDRWPSDWELFLHIYRFDPNKASTLASTLSDN